MQDQPVILLCATLLLVAPAYSQQAPKLTVSGDLPSPLQLTAADLAAMPRQTVTVKDEHGQTNQYEGVLLHEILKRAGAPVEKDLRGNALASYVLAKATDGYQVVFTLAELESNFANEAILITDKRDGKPLPDGQGPFRIVCPNDRGGGRSVRMLDSLLFVKLLK